MLIRKPEKQPQQLESLKWKLVRWTEISGERKVKSFTAHVLSLPANTPQKYSSYKGIGVLFFFTAQETFI